MSNRIAPAEQTPAAPIARMAVCAPITKTLTKKTTA